MRRSDGCVRRWAGLAPVALAAAVAACAPRAVADGAGPCAHLDSVLAQRGLPRPFAMKGRATFDVEKYRVRGRFVLALDVAGGAVLEFTGSTLMGGHREDVVISLAGDTLRILDRERGRFHDGPEAEELVAGGAGVAGSWTLAMRRALTLASGCTAGPVSPRGSGWEGQVVGGRFRVECEDGRIARAIWPDPAPGETFRDRLEVAYGWDGNTLSHIELLLPTRGWRVRLDAN